MVSNKENWRKMGEISYRIAKTQSAIVAVYWRMQLRIFRNEN